MNDYDNNDGYDAGTSIHYMNADYRVIYNVMLENGINIFRSSTKILASSNGALRYYKYNVYCSEDILIGYMVQSILMKDMGPSIPLFRHGGLCSPLYMDLKNLHIEYRGHIVPIAEAPMIPVGTFLTNYRDSRSRLQRHIPELSRTHHYKIELVGTMSVGVYPPCCCTIPKLIFPDLIPWNRYDVFKPEFDFSAPVMNTMMRDTNQNEEMLYHNPNPNVAPAIEMVSADNVFILPSNNQGDSTLVLAATLVEDTCEDTKRANAGHSKKDLSKNNPKAGKTKLELIVEPDETLQFTLARDPYLYEVSSTLTLTNPVGNAYLAFKFKTSQPLHYLLRPNMGVVAPGTSEYININLVKKEKQKLLQSFDCLGQSALDYFNDDRLLVESCKIDETFGKKCLEQKDAFATGHALPGAKTSKELSESLTATWDKLCSEDDSRISSHKLRVRYELDPFLKKEIGKAKFALVIEPEKTLRFTMTRDSFANKVYAILTLTNPGRNAYFAYNIEITNPSRYLEGKKLGVIAPGTSEYINFVLVEKEKQKLLKTFDYLGEPALDHSKGALVVEYCIVDEILGKNYLEQKDALAADHPNNGAKASKELSESLTVMWDKLSLGGDSKIFNRKLRVRHVVTASAENEPPSEVIEKSSLTNIATQKLTAPKEIICYKE
ncbi:hypothetical protein CTEN210_18021 [Chaetoceros tenuissimus]|uniref:MSP domain-containing protein n=1 Tax=Chaetoceros tenuissimus TaxID=426638 RepID=A0AAD3DDT1_9STRA|nr:hypothetical protein CTEN210_18021 [Chaetoceros tenuissimus]